MGEQDALPSTQDAFAGSDVALATLPEVSRTSEESPAITITPQVKSGKVIDALRQFLARDVMVEVIERISEPKQSDRVSQTSIEDVEAVDHVAIEPMIAPVIAPVVTPVAAPVIVPTIDDVSDAKPPQIEPLLAVDALPERSSPSPISIAPPPQARRKRKIIFTAFKSALIEHPATKATTIDVSEVAGPIPATASAPAPATAPSPPPLIGQLPPIKPLAPHTIATLGHDRPASSWPTKLSRLLMPDAIGRGMQHPIVPILTGITFGLCVLWWLLGQ